jgi:RNA polymerase sigma factor (sigma-70 family)
VSDEHGVEQWRAMFLENYSEWHARAAQFLLSTTSLVDFDTAEELSGMCLAHLWETPRCVGQPPHAVKAYLFKMVIHALRRSIRKQRLLSTVPLSQSQHLYSSERPDQTYVSRETVEHIRKAFRGLTDGERRVIILRKFEHYSSEETAYILGMKNAARVDERLSRALRKLRELLGEIGVPA